MRFDGTRGHQPDAKRGKQYRRVLLQQGRLLLDSDVAALVDATEGNLRRLARDTACPAGSPDLGYLVTAGPLLAAFVSDDGVKPDPAPFHAFRDYLVKFLDDLPSLKIDGTAAAGKVELPGRSGLAGVALGSYTKVRIWARGGASIGVALGGASAGTVALTDATSFKPYDVTIPAGGSIGASATIALSFAAAAPGNTAWIGLIEALESATATPRFWVTGGRYWLDGLSVEQSRDGRFPDVSFPPEVGFGYPALPALAVGDRLVAYLEGWERHVTAIEDAGLLEQALGGTDTCTRTRTVGQVKLAKTTLAPADVPLAFAKVVRSRATLDLATKAAPPVTDPCALRESGGYTGNENRLYRFEVDTGGVLGAARLKWSRNNAAELAAIGSVAAGTPSVVSLAAGSGFRNGDIVELLTEQVDLGDSAAATFAAPPAFNPPARAAGALYLLEETAATDAFHLLDYASRSPVTLSGLDAKAKPWKLRRWHGVLETLSGGATVSHFDLPDGVQVDLDTSAGPFAVGDYWQYEARKNGDNANGTWQKAPHGPERIFAPLALLEYGGPGQPVLVVRWYDHRFSPLCELTADEIAFDGDSVHTGADTVQEAIDELYQATVDGCCTPTLSPPAAGQDATAAITSAISTLPPSGGVISLRHGRYELRTKLRIAGKSVELRGCPEALLVGMTAPDPPVEVAPAASLVLRDLTLYTNTAAPALVSLPGGDTDSMSFAAFATAFAHGGAGGAGIAVQVGTQAPVAPGSAPDPSTAHGPLASLHFEDCLFVSGWGVSAARPLALTISRSAGAFAAGGIFALAAQSLVLDGSALRIALDAAAITALAAASLDDIAGVLAGMAARTPLLTTGTALFSGRSSDVRISGCSFSGQNGVWLGDGKAALQANHYVAGRAALVLGGEVGAQGERIDQAAIGCHVPVGGTIDFAGATVHAPRAAVIGGDEVDGTGVARALTYVAIRDSVLGGRVQIGRADLAASTGSIGAVEIRGNLIDVPTATLPLVRAALSGLAPLGNFGLVVADNTIVFPAGGVLVDHGTAVIERNRIRATSGSATGAAIAVQNAEQVLVQANRIELPGAIVGISGVSSGLRISRNTVETGGTSLSTSQCPLRVDDNWFGSIANVQNSLFAEVRGNQFTGGLRVDGTIWCIVVGNYFGASSGAGAILASGDGLVIDPVYTIVIFNVPILGTVQVSDNWSEGTIRVVPHLNAQVISKGTKGATFLQAASGASMMKADGFTAAGALDSGSEPATGGAKPMSFAASAVPLMKIATGGGQFYSKGSLAAGVAKEAADIIAGIGGIIGVFTIYNEDAILLQVNGNRAVRIQVGSVTDSGGTAQVHFFSKVQVVSNRVEKRLLLNDYNNAMVIGNMAHEFTNVPTPSTTPVLSPNEIVF